MRLLLAAGLIVCPFLFLPVARADVGGQIPGPGNCDYPATGTWGLDGVAVYDWVCDHPTEINGSHHHCQMAGVAGQGQIQGGANVMMFNVQASVGGNIGVLRGACWWACPDLSLAAEPNPVQSWQGGQGSNDPVKRSPCNSIGPNPLASATP